MRLVILSDTHNSRPDIPDGDVLIHCGDHTYHGKPQESLEALEWLSEQMHQHKVIIAGNHEVGWQNEAVRTAMFLLYPSLTYLHDSGVTIGGLKFWGSPVQPIFHNWAFQKPRGEPLREHWEKVPEGTDILVTHGPPLGFGDINLRDERFGDEDLFKKVMAIKPQVHCYGHAHAGYGHYFFEGIHFINAAIMSERYIMTNDPIVVDIDARQH